MDPERWKQVDELLQSALALPSNERGRSQRAIEGDRGRHVVRRGWMEETG
jgi:hypothetical protein